MLLVIKISLKHGWYGVGYWLLEFTLHISDNYENNGCPLGPNKTFQFQQITGELGSDSVTPVWRHTVGSNRGTGSLLSLMVFHCVDRFWLQWDSDATWPQIWQRTAWPILISVMCIWHVCVMCIWHVCVMCIWHVCVMCIWHVCVMCIWHVCVMCIWHVCVICIWHVCVICIWHVCVICIWYVCVICIWHVCVICVWHVCVICVWHVCVICIWHVCVICIWHVCVICIWHVLRVPWAWSQTIEDWLWCNPRSASTALGLLSRLLQSGILFILPGLWPRPCCPKIAKESNRISKGHTPSSGS